MRVPPSTQVLSEDRARAILREYPDADLSAFVVESSRSVDDLAAEEVGKAMRAIAARMEERRG